MTMSTDSPPSEIASSNEKLDVRYVEKTSSGSGSAQTIWDVLPKNQPAWYYTLIPITLSRLCVCVCADCISRWKQKHLLLLNLGMIVPYLSSTTNGYDGSMLNGLQSMVGDARGHDFDRH